MNIAQTRLADAEVLELERMREPLEKALPAAEDHGATMIIGSSTAEPRALAMGLAPITTRTSLSSAAPRAHRGRHLNPRHGFELAAFGLLLRPVGDTKKGSPYGFLPPQ
jgi:hypothetical protein